MLPLAFVLMQFIVSAKAGLVNYVDGHANVHMHEQIPAGKPIETGLNSHVEVLLNPGTFLRVAENSTVVFDSVDLTNIDVRVVSGSAFLEAADIEKRTPIRITTGGLTVSVVSRGMYRFYGDTAVVLDGKLRTADSSITVKKGQQITSNGDQYKESKIPLSAGLDDLEVWSRQRSSSVAKANTLAYNGQSGAMFYPFSSMNGAAWMYSPFLSGFTFIPRDSYRSYWGYSFVPIFAFDPSIFPRPPVQTTIARPSSSLPSAAAAGSRGGASGPFSSMSAPSHTSTSGGFGGSSPHPGGARGGGGGAAHGSR
jgi:hypothetical protein